MPSITLHETTDASADGVLSYSPFCLKVHAALLACGLPYARAHAAYPGAWKSLNPAGQVPVVVIDGTAVADSTVIVRRLRELAPGKLNVGFSPRDEGDAFIVEEFADADLNGFLVASRWLDDRNWPRTSAAFFGAAPAPVRLLVPALVRRGVLKRLIARDIWLRGEADCWARFQRLLDALDARAPVSGFWIAEGLSTADVALFGQLRSFMTSLTPWHSAEVAARPQLLAWLKRVEAACQASH